MNEYIRHISTVVENASDVQEFLGLKEIERNIANDEENLLCITEEARIMKTSVKMEFTNEIEGLEQELNMMGNL